MEINSFEEINNKIDLTKDHESIPWKKLNLSTKFIRENIDIIDFVELSKNPNLSKDIIKEFRAFLYWIEISEHYKDIDWLFKNDFYRGLWFEKLMENENVTSKTMEILSDISNIYNYFDRVLSKFKNINNEFITKHQCYIKENNHSKDLSLNPELDKNAIYLFPDIIDVDIFFRFNKNIMNVDWLKKRFKKNKTKLETGLDITHILGNKYMTMEVLNFLNELHGIFKKDSLLTKIFSYSDLPIDFYIRYENKSNLDALMSRNCNIKNSTKYELMNYMKLTK